MSIEKLQNMSTEQLLDLFELTTDINDVNISTVRGWLMDEIERRFPEKFEAWLDSNECEDGDLRKFIYK